MRNKGDKFIIEIGEVIEADAGKLYKIKNFNSLVFDDGAFDNYTFTEIWATRAPSLDKFYSGKRILEWCDDDDRVLMVREAGFYCGYEMQDADCDCEVCPAKQWCQRYERMKEKEHADGA